MAPTGTKRPYRSHNSSEVYAAAGSFQLIHARPDLDYGQVNATSTQASYPSGMNYATDDSDNIVNFADSGRTLEDAALIQSMVWPWRASNTIGIILDN